MKRSGIAEVIRAEDIKANLHNIKIGDKMNRSCIAEIIRAEDVKDNLASFGQFPPPKPVSGSHKDLNPRLFRPVQISQNKELLSSNKAKEHSVFRPLFDNRQKHNQDSKVEQQSREIESKAIKIIKAAEKQAAEIKEKARIEGYNEGVERGKNEGLERGKNEALEATHKEIQSLVQFLSNSLKEISALSNAVSNEMETNILKLSLFIAKKLAYREISMHPDAIVDIVKNALRLVENGNRILIKVNPLDLQLVKKYRPDILHLLNSSSGNEALEDSGKSEDIDVNLVIESDETISRGGCVIETQTQSVDATFETRLDEIVNAII